MKDEVPNSSNKAHDLFKKGEFEAAAAIFRAQAEKEPSDYELLLNEGIALGRAGHPREALEVINRYLSVAPDDLDALVEKGALLGELGQNEAAVSVLHEVLKLDEGNWFALYNLGISLEEMGELSEAVNMFRRALVALPDSRDTLVRLVDLLYGQDRYQEILGLLARESLVVDNNSQLNVLAGNCSFLVGRETDAIAYYSKAVDLDGNNSLALFGLARVYAGLNQDTSRDYLKRAIVLDPRLIAEAKKVPELTVLLTDIGRSNLRD